MKIYELKPAVGSKKKPKRVGRGPGSGHGKTSCRGHKGQKSRSGGSVRPGFEGGQMPLARRLPKRGFRHPKDKYFIVNIGQLDSRFEAGEEVTPEKLCQHRLIRKLGPKVKILGNGELKKRLVVRAHEFSQAAASKIVAAGGQTGAPS